VWDLVEAQVLGHPPQQGDGAPIQQHLLVRGVQQAVAGGQAVHLETTSKHGWVEVDRGARNMSCTAPRANRCSAGTDRNNANRVPCDAGGNNRYRKAAHHLQNLRGMRW
jgi:hypothetical protein